MPQRRSEDSYIFNDILPFLASYEYPIHDSERVKIKEVPIFRPSGKRSGSSPDIVYYHNGEPVLLVEAKAKHKTHEKALKEALVYLRNFPIDHEEYAPSGLPPKILATTVGTDIKFYKWSINYKAPLPDFDTVEIQILSFEKLLEYYGFVHGYKARLLSTKEFKIDFFDELVAIYKKELNKDKITPKLINKVVYQILNFIIFREKYTGQYPYTEISLQGQKAVRDLFNRFDLIKSIGPLIAKEFRKSILRAFQGTISNLYLTEPCVISFMVSLIEPLKQETKVLDFECGSGGFLAEVCSKGVNLENIRGIDIDIDDLPCIIAKTYLAIYLEKTSKNEIEALPIKQGNGLFYHGENWDLVISNPAGGNKYEHGDEDKIISEGLINLTDREHQFSEYELSIQQAVRSAKIGGKICLILPEGFFSNSQDDFLRKFVTKHCKILAIISLPRFAFSKGTSVENPQYGSQSSSQKMSIIYGTKIREIDKENPIGSIDFDTLNYPVFLASISEPESKKGRIEDWLKPCLNKVIEQWHEWQTNHNLKELPPVIIEIQDKKAKRITTPSSEEKIQAKSKHKQKPIPPKSKTKISKDLEDLF